MTAYEEETLSQIREISELRAKVNVLEERVDSLTSLVVQLRKLLQRQVYGYAQEDIDEVWNG